MVCLARPSTPSSKPLAVSKPQSIKFVRNDPYRNASSGCKSKVKSTKNLIQPYLDAFQIRHGLPAVNADDLDGAGGAFSNDINEIQKWWVAYFAGQPEYWSSLKKTTDKGYSPSTLERYMSTPKNELCKKLTSLEHKYIIEEAFKPAYSHLQKLIKKMKRENGPPKEKIYSDDDITFILERCLWLNTKKDLDFYVFQHLLLRLCSRATETSQLQVSSLSLTSHIEDSLENKILRIYLVRDKDSKAEHIPLIPNREQVLGDPVLAIGLSLLVHNSDLLLPSIAPNVSVARDKEAAASKHYNQSLKAIWTHYSPSQDQSVTFGTSHYGKHTTLYQLDSAKLHEAAQCYGGWKVKGEGARNHYASNPWPYMLDGAKYLGNWSRLTNRDWQAVRVPYYNDQVSEQICNALFGHVPGLESRIKHFILVCMLSKWDRLEMLIRSEPNERFADPCKHLIFLTLSQRLSAAGVSEHAFRDFKSKCASQFNEVNKTSTTELIGPYPLPRVIAPTPPEPDESVSTLTTKSSVRPISSLLDDITKTISLETVFKEYFESNFMESYKSLKGPSKLRDRYKKLKTFIAIGIRYSIRCPTPESPPTMIEAKNVVESIKSCLLEAQNSGHTVKYQGKKPFGINTPLSKTVIRENQRLLTDSTKTWYRTLPPDIPHSIREHFFHHKPDDF